MKQQTSKPVASKPVMQNTKHTRPQNKDDMDSRANEEQDFKGDDVTHNTKETKKDHHKQSK